MEWNVQSTTQINPKHRLSLLLSTEDCTKQEQAYSPSLTYVIYMAPHVGVAVMISDTRWTRESKASAVVVANTRLILVA